jgi:small-conductance mechanosensitive channel
MARPYLRKGRSMRMATNSCSLSRVFLLLLLTLFVLVLPFSGNAAAQEDGDSGRLSGVVLNLYYESPVPHAYIIVESADGYKEARTTNEDGEYRFHLPYGTYSLRAFVRDEEVANATGIIVDPSPIVHDIPISFQLDEPVHLHGVMKIDGERAGSKKVVFEGIGNSYRNETITQKNGSYSFDVPFGTILVTIYEDDETAGDEEIGPFVNAGSIVRNVDIERTGAAPSIGEWGDFVVATWTGLAIWAAVVIGLVFLYIYIRRRVNEWLEESSTRFHKNIDDLIAYATKGYGKAALLYFSLLALDAVLDVGSEVAAKWISFWLNALVWILVLWVTGRVALKLVDHLLITLRARREKAGSEIPETAYIFVHGILRYLVIIVIGFLILLIPLAGLGLYDEISGGFGGFVDKNLGYLLLLIIIVILFFITNRFVKLTLEQMKVTSTRFSPQMIGIFGLIARVGIIFLFMVLFIFTLLTMAGMQEMGALIMALLTTMVGMIVAMTTTGAIGNSLAGMVLLTLKPFEQGDFVEVYDGQFGKVIGVSTFFTRLRTFKNEIIEVPNNLVLAGKITNFSTAKHIGIEITVAIGYDYPADIILDLLKNGAKATKGIVRDPKPQAMITEFGDYAVTFLLRAFTEDVDRYFQTKSSLLENIQDIFYTEGIEIMTPWQMVKREDQIPSRDEVIKRYINHMKHRDLTEDGDESIAAGMDVLERNNC